MIPTLLFVHKNIQFLIRDLTSIIGDNGYKTQLNTI